HALVHHSLQMPEYTTTIDLAAYLQQLCRAICHSKLERQRIALSLSLHPLRMDSERCWLLRMIVFELITNAARHAFAGRAGAIRLDVRLIGTTIECRIEDNGTAAETPSPGRGIAIIEALVTILHGTLDMKFGPN